MEQYSIIDLHMHSTCSDGTDTPEELLEKNKRLKMKVFAICDHDTIESTLILRRTNPEAFEKTSNPRFVTGVELSCFNELGKYHILGLNYNEKAKSIQDIVNELSIKRKEKLRLRIENIERQFNIAFGESIVREWDEKISVGKPHIANELVRMGYASNKQEAIDIYIKPADTNKNTRMETKKAIEAIHSAEGIAIWAHPLGGIGSEILFPCEFEKRLRQLVGEGLDGIECHYSLYSQAQQDYLKYMANKYNLLISCGSDYHGKNKEVHIGEIGNDVKIPQVNNITVLKKI